MTTRQNFRAVTKSGSIYTCVDGIVHIHAAEGGIDVFKVLSLKVVDRNVVASWQEVYDAPEAEGPVIGKALYVSSLDNYRLSTDVVAVGPAEPEG